MNSAIAITPIGGPTAIIEVHGLRILTDPTFDAAGGVYSSGAVTLEKKVGPAVLVDALGGIDVVLLSHEQHADNLDTSGRELLSHVGLTLTTLDSAERLGGTAKGLAPWATYDLPTPDGKTIRVTATPARHGPHGIEPLTGLVTGFVLTLVETGEDLIYITGDTVWFEGVAEVARRFHPRVVVPFAGAAQTRGAFHLTMSVNDVIELAAAIPDSVVVPLHHDGWAHFTQSQDDLAGAMNAVGQGDRLRKLATGVSTRVV